MTQGAGGAMAIGSAASSRVSDAVSSRTAIRSYLIPDLPSTAELEPHLRRVDQARWYSNFGPLVCEFESQLQDRIAVRHSNRDPEHIFLTTLASGFDALEAGLRLYHLKRCQRVLVPAVTFSACPLAVEHAGLEVALVDVDPTSWVLTPHIARAAAARMELAAVMPVAAYGVPLPVADWDAFVAETGIPVLIDAAAAFETQAPLKHGFVAHSLHATKPFGIGEGGILVACDPDAIAKARTYTNFGMVERVGYMDGANAKMSEYHAAVGLAQMMRWDDIKTRRRLLLNLYRDHLKALSEYLSLQPSISEAVVSCLMLLVKGSAVDLIAAAKQTGDIGLHRTYLPPLYRQPYFARFPVVDTDGNVLRSDAEIIEKSAHMPNSERLMSGLVGVPFHPFMDEDDVIAVVETLRSLIH